MIVSSSRGVNLFRAAKFGWALTLGFPFFASNFWTVYAQSAILRLLFRECGRSTLQRRRMAMSLATMETAISPGVAAPILKPIGAKTRLKLSRRDALSLELFIDSQHFAPRANHADILRRRIQSAKLACIDVGSKIIFRFFLRDLGLLAVDRRWYPIDHFPCRGVTIAGILKRFLQVMGFTCNLICNLAQ